MFTKTSLTPIQKNILSCIERGATIDDILMSVYQGDGEPEYSYNSIRTILMRLRRYGFVISNRRDGIHQGKTGRATKAFYRLVSTPEVFKWKTIGT